MFTSETTPFVCPNCSAKYRVVKVEADLGTKQKELICLSCGGPLSGREGVFFLKYFLVDKPSRSQDRRH